MRCVKENDRLLQSAPFDNSTRRKGTQHELCYRRAEGRSSSTTDLKSSKTVCDCRIPNLPGHRWSLRMHLIAYHPTDIRDYRGNTSLFLQKTIHLLWCAHLHTCIIVCKNCADLLLNQGVQRNDFCIILDVHSEQKRDAIVGTVLINSIMKFLPVSENKSLVRTRNHQSRLT